MQYQRIEYYSSGAVLVVRFVPVTRVPSFGRQLRDELLDVVRRLCPRNIVVDFGSYLCWPVDTLGCLAHAKQASIHEVTIHCVGMPLQLKAAARFLSFNGGVFEEYDRLETAIDASERWSLPSSVGFALAKTA